MSPAHARSEVGGEERGERVGRGAREGRGGGQRSAPRHGGGERATHCVDNDPSVVVRLAAALVRVDLRRRLGNLRSRVLAKERRRRLDAPNGLGALLPGLVAGRRIFVCLALVDRAQRPLLRQLEHRRPRVGTHAVRPETERRAVHEILQRRGRSVVAEPILLAEVVAMNPSLRAGVPAVAAREVLSRLARQRGGQAAEELKLRRLGRIKANHELVLEQVELVRSVGENRSHHPDAVRLVVRNTEHELAAEKRLHR